MFALVALHYLQNDGVVFFTVGAIHLVVLIVADHVLVGWHFNDFQAVDFRELASFSHGGAGHAGKFRVQAKVILEGDRCESLVFLLYSNAFFGFQCLVQSIRKTTAFHHAASKFVNDNDFVALHDVIRVALKQRVRAQGLVHMMNK